MITKTFKGLDGLELFYDIYEAKECNSVLQIIHGSVEHGLRYSHFAESMASNGVTVYVMDLRGHGRSLKGIPGVLSDEDHPWNLYVKETYKLTEIIKADLPGKKVFVMGHSMGSFILRDYLSFYSRDIDGAIISGTGSTDKFTIAAAKIIVKMALKKHDKHSQSEKLNELMFGPLNKKARKLGLTSFISRDEAVVKKYNDDPLCGYVITIEYAGALLEGLGRINKSSAYDIDTIPLMMVSGELDPVGGNMGSFVKKVANKYLKNGNEVEMYLYEDALHEMINEINKEEVYKDILNWIGAH